MNAPSGVRGADNFKPLGNARLARVDLLAATDKANRHGPIGVTVQAGDQEVRLRLCETRARLLRCMKSAVLVRFQARWASSKIAT